MNPKIISLSAIPGAGKTSLGELLISILSNAVLLPADDYQQVTEQPVDMLDDWLDGGADYDLFDLSLALGALNDLKNGRSVKNPVDGSIVQSAELIIFETHYGKCHSDSAKLIDFAVWIDTPLDVALARNIIDLSDSSDSFENSDSGEQLRWLHNYTQQYLQYVRPSLLDQEIRVKQSSDLVLDGSESPQLLAQQLVKGLETQYGKFSESVR
jgi:uridine kinase